MHSFVMSNGRSASVVSKSLIENDLIEEFHWLPQDIDKIPYKKLQMFFLIRREKNAARDSKRDVDENKQKQKSGTSGSGQSKRYKKI